MSEFYRHVPLSGGKHMKDDFLLLLTATVVALLAWSFWHFLGEAAISVFSTLALLIVAADNMRLRRRLKAEQRG